ncbi:hypothetical protein ACFWMQ_15880 [Streptomyces sp. NPDC058372]|uniref:hypothetical protein n=1 Tax=Streptomyces sp. NPDC058372 TaxID=3346464 RepID=UPI0036512EA6
MTTPLDVETFRFHLTEELTEYFGDIARWDARLRHAAEHAVLVRRDMGEYFHTFVACLEGALNEEPARRDLPAARLSRQIIQRFGSEAGPAEIDLGWAFEAGLPALFDPKEHHAFKLALLKAAKRSTSAEVTPSAVA